MCIFQKLPVLQVCQSLLNLSRAPKSSTCEAGECKKKEKKQKGSNVRHDTIAKFYFVDNKVFTLLQRGRKNHLRRLLFRQTASTSSSATTKTTASTTLPATGSTTERSTKVSISFTERTLKLRGDYLGAVYY